MIGILISQAELDLLPTSGAAWTNIAALAAADGGPADMSNQDSTSPAYQLAAALAYKRDGSGKGRTAIVNKLKALPGTETNSLGIFRQFHVWLIVADLIDMDPNTVCNDGRTWGDYVEFMWDAPAGQHSKWNAIQRTAEISPNNFGGQARAAGAALAVYQQDWARLAQIYEYLARSLGDLTYPNTFPNPTNSLTDEVAPSWVCNFATSNGGRDPGYLALQGLINPNCSALKNGLLAEDGTRSNPTPGADPVYVGHGLHYPLGHMDGAILAAVICHRFRARIPGYRDLWTGVGNDQAIRRFYTRWDQDGTIGDQPARFWNIPHVVNHVYGTAFTAPAVSVGWALNFMDWFTDPASTWMTDTGGGSGNNPPTAALTLTNPSGSIVTADFSGSTAGTAALDTYSIDWGDGSSVQTGPAAAGTADHTYATNGVKTVSLTITDTSGLTSTIERTIALNTAQSPVAVLELSPLTGLPPLTVAYDASGSFDPDGTAVTYSLDWGDGTAPDTTATGSHTYPVQAAYPATFSVQLTVTSGGESVTTTKKVTVTSPFEAPASGKAFVYAGQDVWLPVVPGLLTGIQTAKVGSWWGIGGTSGTNPLGDQVLKAYPITIIRDMTVDQIAVEITLAGSAGAVVRFGLYADNGDGAPGALIAESTVQSAEATGQPTYVLPSAIELKAGAVIWAATVVQGAAATAPEFRTVGGLDTAPSSTSAATALGSSYGYTQSGVSGALPASFTDTPGTSGIVARVVLHRSA